jgi:hypothetical protein
MRMAGGMNQTKIATIINPRNRVISEWAKIFITFPGFYNDSSSRCGTTANSVGLGPAGKSSLPAARLWASGIIVEPSHFLFFWYNHNLQFP